MALSLVLRNASKLNGARLFKVQRIAPLTTLTTASNVSAKLVLKNHPQFLTNGISPHLQRAISLSSPRHSYINHSTIWGGERIVSGALMATIPLAFWYPSQATDALLAVSVVLHTHWGMEALVTDYLKGGIAKVGHIGLFLISIATLGGMFYLIYNDVGVANAVKKLWAVKGYVPLDPKAEK